MVVTDYILFVIEVIIIAIVFKKILFKTKKPVKLSQVFSKYFF